MTNSLWLVSQLKHVLWELFLGLTKRDLSPVPQIWAEKQAFSACLICRLHPGEIWGKAFANAWKMRAVLQPAWMLPQCLQLQGRWIDPQNNPTQTWPWDDASKMPCLMHIYYEYLFVRYSNGMKTWTS